MTQTLVEAVMTHRCTIERDAGSTDRYTAADFQPLLSDQRCFLSNQTGRLDVAPERSADSDTMRLMLPSGTDVTTNDRVTSVTRDGVEILGGVASVVAPPRDHHDHLEAELQLVTGGS